MLTYPHPLPPGMSPRCSQPESTWSTEHDLQLLATQTMVMCTLAPDALRSRFLAARLFRGALRPRRLTALCSALVRRRAAARLQRAEACARRPSCWRWTWTRAPFSSFAGRCAPARGSRAVHKAPPTLREAPQWRLHDRGAATHEALSTACGSTRRAAARRIAAPCVSITI
jgi:hypothetical protein